MSRFALNSILSHQFYTGNAFNTAFDHVDENDTTFRPSIVPFASKLEKGRLRDVYAQIQGCGTNCTLISVIAPVECSGFSKSTKLRVLLPL